MQKVYLTKLKKRNVGIGPCSVEVEVVLTEAKNLVRTDQSSLKYLWVEDHYCGSAKVASKADEAQLSIEYKKGKDSDVADALSRRD